MLRQVQEGTDPSGECHGDHRRIHVLYCILDNRFGGPHRRAHTVAQRLREHHVETLFLTGYKGGDTWRPDDFPSYICKHLQCFRRRWPLGHLALFTAVLPYTLFRLCRIIKAKDIDIVHVDGVTNFVPALAAGLTGTTIVWHYNDHPPNPLRWLLLRLVRVLSSAVIVQGERLKAVRTGSDPKLHDKTVVLYPGIDLHTFDPARYNHRTRAGLRKEFGIPADSPLVGVLGDMNRLKGHAYFIRAAKRIKEKVPNAKFLVVGRKLNTDPGYWNRMQRLTAACGLERDMIFAGFREDIAAVLSMLDVFVLSSILESCPNVVLEAMAMKVPVVATDVGAVSEVILHGRTGLVVPPHDDRAIAQAVLRHLRTPPPERDAMLQAARERVENVFSLNETAGRQKRLYEELAAGNR